MRKKLLQIFLVSVPIIALGQDKSSWQRSALGAHFFMGLYSYKDSATAPSSHAHAYPGLAISYLRGLSPHYDIEATLSGSFASLNSASGSGNHLLIEGDAAAHYKLLQGTRTVLPNIQFGLGLSGYNGSFGMYAPIGAGIEAKVLDEAFFVACAQYRIMLTGIPQSRFYISAGITGILRKSMKKPKPKQPALHLSRPPQTEGIKDSDGDGIPDSVDACPLVKGFARYKGCPIPDSDGDGINDEEDSCPHTPGLAKYKGCPIPDRDGDGINDEDDQCPDVPGIAANHGCPEIKKEVLATLRLAAKNIYFNTNKYVILPRSFRGLDSVAAILRADTHLQLIIEGHTDNVGSVKDNLLLSQRRAESVQAYISGKGVAKSRLQAAGYGLSRPVADNRTAKGRAENRRVELWLHYY